MINALILLLQKKVNTIILGLSRPLSLNSGLATVCRNAQLIFSWIVLLALLARTGIEDRPSISWCFNESHIVQAGYRWIIGGVHHGIVILSLLISSCVHCFMPPFLFSISIFYFYFSFDFQGNYVTLADMKRIWMNRKFSYIFEARSMTNAAFFMQSLYAHCISMS